MLIYLMSETEGSADDIKNNTRIDDQGNIIVDFSKQLLPMTPKSTITVKIGDLSYTMEPINTIHYYTYNQMLEEADGDKDKEKTARDWLVASCMKDPILSMQDVAELPIGLFFAIFNVLMNKSFLLHNV